MDCPSDIDHTTLGMSYLQLVGAFSVLHHEFIPLFSISHFSVGQVTNDNVGVDELGLWL